MLNDIVKDIADTVKDGIQSGLKSISDKFEARFKAIEELIESIPIAEKGDKGDSVTVEDVRPILDEMVKAIPVPKDGEDGKSVTIDDVKPIIDAAVAEAVKSIPVPKDGQNAEIDYDKVRSIVEEIIKEAVANIHIPIPKDGDDGRDAIDVEIEPGIDEEKSYPRGTYATHNGGLWRSYEKTNAMRGWECIVDGIASIDVEYDGERKAVVKISKSSGSPVEKNIHLPAVLSKGFWKEGAYEKGDMVQLSGSSWLAIVDTTDRPGDATKDWILAAKQGGTGKSAFDIARQAGFEGTREQWLDSLGKKTVVKVNA